MSNVTDAKVILEAIVGHTVAPAKTANIVKGFLNFPNGTNEDIAGLFKDQLKSDIAKKVKAYSEQKQLDADQARAIDAGRNALTDFDPA